MRQLLWKVSVFMRNIRCSNINVPLLMIPYQNTANLLRSPILNRKYLPISNTPKCSRLLGLLRSGEQNKSKTKQEGGERKCSDKCQWKWNRSRKKERGSEDVETEFKVCPDTTNSPSVSQVRTSAPIMGHPDHDTERCSTTPHNLGRCFLTPLWASISARHHPLVHALSKMSSSPQQFKYQLFILSLHETNSIHSCLASGRSFPPSSQAQPHDN